MNTQFANSIEYLKYTIFNCCKQTLVIILENNKNVVKGSGGY